MIAWMFNWLETHNPAEDGNWLKVVGALFATAIIIVGFIRLLEWVT